MADAVAGSYLRSTKTKKVVIMTNGSRGDAQPFVALGLGLKKALFDVLVLTNVNHVDFLTRFGLQAIGTRSSYEEIVQSPEFQKAIATGEWEDFGKKWGKKFMKENPDSFEKEREEVKKFKPDLLLATYLSYTSAFFIETLYKIPCMSVHFAGVSVEGNNKFNRIGEFVQWQGELAIGNEMYGEHLGGALWPTLDSFMLDKEQPITPSLRAWPRELCARPMEWQKITGFLVIPSETTQADKIFGGETNATLEKFLSEGDMAPVYIGWGSMSSAPVENMARLAVRSLKKAGLRGIILGGWAKLNAQMIKEPKLQEYVTKNVLFVESAHHESLFPRCSVIVHHGGAGTCAAALRAGVPSIVTPFFMDQPTNGKIIADAGVGLVTDDFRTVTADQLGPALHKCASDSNMRAKCQDLGKRLQEHQGTEAALAEINRFIEEEVETGQWRQRFERRCRRRIGPPQSEEKTKRDVERAFMDQGAKLSGDDDVWKQVRDARLGGTTRLFAGAGHSLRSSSEGDKAAQLLMDVELKEHFREVDTGKPMCSIRVKLPDRKTIVANLNNDFTVRNVRAWLECNHRKCFTQGYHLMDRAVFPPAKLMDFDAQLEQLGLVQKGACLECHLA